MSNHISTDHSNSSQHVSQSKDDRNNDNNNKENDKLIVNTKANSFRDNCTQYKKLLHRNIYINKTTFDKLSLEHTKSKNEHRSVHTRHIQNSYNNYC